MRSDFDLQAWYQNLFFQKKSVQNLFTLNCPEKNNLHTTSEQTLFYDFCNTFLKNLCKHLTQKVFQKNPCPDLITKSFIEKQTCLSKKNHRLKCVFHCFKKKLIHNNSPLPCFSNTNFVFRNCWGIFWLTNIFICLIWTPVKIETQLFHKKLMCKENVA